MADVYCLQTTTCDQTKKEMKVFELFSGIGGMHFAFKESGIEGTIVRALDINTTANSVYRHNFPSTHLMENNVQSLTSEFLTKLEIDMITLSPPCQPYTRQGNMKGDLDPRSDALRHFLSLIPELPHLKYLLLENVVGFETSSTRDQVITVLKHSGFHYQEFILTPTQFGIPNSRSRYYLLAKKGSFSFNEKDTIHTELPTNDKMCRTIGDYLDVKGALVPDKVLIKHADILDIALKDSIKTCCFTKAYTHYIEGTGSVLCPKSKEELDSVYSELQNLSKDDVKYLDLLKSLEMRYFSPEEVARLMSFPSWFRFPDNLTLKQKYRLLGNSINVYVVSVLIKLLCS